MYLRVLRCLQIAPESSCGPYSYSAAGILWLGSGLPPGFGDHSLPVKGSNHHCSHRGWRGHTYTAPVRAHTGPTSFIPSGIAFLNNILTVFTESMRRDWSFKKDNSEVCIKSWWPSRGSSWSLLTSAFPAPVTLLGHPPQPTADCFQVAVHSPQALIPGSGLSRHKEEARSA